MGRANKSERRRVACAECGKDFTFTWTGGPNRTKCDKHRHGARKVRRRRTRARGEPFTVGHFEEWAYELVLDTGERWRVEPWFLDFMEDLFAGVRETWLLVPEGNSKTTGLAGAALYHTEHTHYAWVPWAASSRDQAEIGYMQAEGFVQRTPRLRTVFKCHPGYRKIKCHTSFGRIQIFAADARTGDGPIPTWSIIDELHRHRNMNLYRTWTGKLDKRGGQMSTISTAGEPGTEFEGTREMVRKMANRVTSRGRCFNRYESDQMVVHEYAVPSGGDIEDLELVKEANPFSGITLESLERKRNSATMTDHHWSRFTCNMAVQSEAAAIRDAEWDALEADISIPEGQAIWLGIDIAWKWDTTALVPYWMPDRQRRIIGESQIIEPPRDGTSLHPSVIEHAIRAIHRRNPLHTVVIDRERAEQLAVWIEETFDCRVVERAQTPALLIQDYDRLMESIRSKWLSHPADPILRRHVLNAVAKMLPSGACYFTRPSSTRDSGDQDLRVIDGLSAMAMVHSAAVGEPPPRKSAYASRGLLVV